jgi:hypothetical protein
MGNQIVSNEELLISNMLELDALRRVLVKKGLITDDEVLEEVKEVRKELGDKVKRSSREN